VSSLYVFKSLLETDRYLSFYLLSKQRYSLSEFRCTSHTLHMEVGRHTGVEQCQKKCTKYPDIRETYLFGLYVRVRDLVSFYSLMSSRHDDIIKKIALYVSKLVDRFDIHTNCF